LAGARRTGDLACGTLGALGTLAAFAAAGLRPRLAAAGEKII
jgi:hypothetical protein